MYTPVSRTHILDDFALGGVVKALENFAHPRLANGEQDEVVALRDHPWHGDHARDTAILHFTASWRKLPYLLRLRRSKRFRRIIMIEHSYTEGFETEQVTDVPRFRAMLKLAYRLVDCVVAVSNSQRDWMVRAGLAPAEKIIAIPQSRNVSNLMSLPIVTRVGGPLRLGAYGRFHTQKGFDLLVEAMSGISPSHCRLEIAGYGEAEERLKAMTHALTHVTLRPVFEHPSTFLSGVDVVAIPSRWEAFGLVGTEARAAGRPIIAADVDGLREQTGCHSWSHRPGDIDDLRRVILVASNARDLARRGVAARTHVEAEFEAMIESWAALLQQMNDGAIAA